MQLLMVRYSDNGESTFSMLFLPNGEFICYALEDRFNIKNDNGQQRIPAGVWPLRFRKEGGMYMGTPDIKGYKDLYASIGNAAGMIEIVIPGWQYVMIHCGNNAEQTLGCPLVCNCPNNNQTQKGFGMNSADAYKRFYPIISKMMAQEECNIKIVDEQSWILGL